MGSLTFMSGTAARRPLPGAAIGSASASAIEGLARSLALDLAPIRVNAIRPGWVDTPMVSDFLGDRRDVVLEEIAKSLPLKRIGRPEEIAEGVLFLMQNDYITGTTLTIDGGALLV